MDELKEGFTADIDYTVSYDISNFLNASMKVVYKTLLEAFILVSLVVFIFLQDWRSTLIPALTVPVSLVGTFLFMQLFGFSINLITLFALVLAIGIVVDNAIVVVEAVHYKMATFNMSPLKATDDAMQEITGAIIAITLVMSAVFIPVSFIPGPTGIFYREFSLTMAVAIVLSGVVALTLTPALCVMLLKPHQHGHAPKNWLDKFLLGFNKRYDGVENKFQNIIQKISPKRLLIFGILIFYSEYFILLIKIF